MSARLGGMLTCRMLFDCMLARRMYRRHIVEPRPRNRMAAAALPRPTAIHTAVLISSAGGGGGLDIARSLDTRVPGVIGNSLQKRRLRLPPPFLPPPFLGATTATIPSMGASAP